jgi:hypothetical protein
MKIVLVRDGADESSFFPLLLEATVVMELVMIRQGCVSDTTRVRVGRNVGCRHLYIAEILIRSNPFRRWKLG